MGLSSEEMQAARARYDKRVATLIRRGDKVQLRDIRRIRTSFASFSKRAVAALPAARYQLTRGIAETVLRDVAVELDALARQLGGTMTEGMAAQVGLSRELRAVFGEAFLPDQLEQVLGISQTARAIDAASAVSADLIALREGGLTARMLSEVNGIVRRAALGIAGQTAFDATTELMQAFRGDRLRRWRFAAERIYRTETLRVHSILTEQALRDFNTRIPTSRRWLWSGISRREHQSINGQIVGMRQRFTVPLKEGGSVKLRFPRDPGGPPSAVINCGCYLNPIPTAAAKQPATALTRRRRVPRRRIPKPGPGRPAPTGARPTLPPPLPKPPPGQRIPAAQVLARARAVRRAALGPKAPPSVTARIKAAKKELQKLQVAEKITRGRNVTEEAYASALERIAVDHARMRARFPGFRAAPLGELQIARGGAGSFGTRFARTPGGYKPMHRIRVGAQADFPKGTNRQIYRMDDDPLGEVSRTWSNRRWNKGVEDQWRHEYGHYLDELYNLQKDPEFRRLLKKYPSRARRPDGRYHRTPGEPYPGSARSWWARHAESEYASRHYGYDHADGGIEAWAELVRLVTRETYVRGTLPADIEGFAFRILEATPPAPTTG